MRTRAIVGRQHLPTSPPSVAAGHSIRWMLGCDWDFMPGTWSSCSGGSHGVLTGEYTADSTIPRGRHPSAGTALERLLREPAPVAGLARRRHRVREVLTSDGRTLAQGALAWIWARSPRALPIPGFRSVAQIEENAGAIAFGPLGAQPIDQIDQLLGRGSCAAKP